MIQNVSLGSTQACFISCIYFFSFGKSTYLFKFIIVITNISDWLFPFCTVQWYVFFWLVYDGQNIFKRLLLGRPVLAMTVENVATIPNMLYVDPRTTYWDIGRYYISNNGYYPAPRSPCEKNLFPVCSVRCGKSSRKLMQRALWRGDL